jgi:hypothetical protein
MLPFETEPSLWSTEGSDVNEFRHAVVKCQTSYEFSQNFTLRSIKHCDCIKPQQ